MMQNPGYRQICERFYKAKQICTCFVQHSVLFLHPDVGLVVAGIGSYAIIICIGEVYVLLIARDEIAGFIMMQ